MVNQIKLVVAIAGVLIILIPSIVLAHKVSILAYEEENIVYCESFYQDGKPVVDGSFTVKSHAGDFITNGKTDPHGLFQFPYPGHTDFQITLDTLMGHRNSIRFNKEAKKETSLLGEGLGRRVFPKMDPVKLFLGISAIFSLFGISAYLLSKQK